MRGQGGAREWNPIISEDPKASKGKLHQITFHGNEFYGKTLQTRTHLQSEGAVGVV